MMRRGFRTVAMAATALSLAMLAGCGPDRGAGASLLQSAAGGLLGGEEEAAPAVAVTGATLPPAVLAGFEGPLIFAEAMRTGGGTLMTEVGRNGPIRSWRGPQGFGLALDDRFVLRSTRGLVFDLMASNPNQTAAALAARRTGPVARTMVHLDGDVQERRQRHTCDLRRDGAESVTIAQRSVTLTRMTETCRTEEGVRYENIYWLDGQNRALRSLQWVSEGFGHLRITILRS
jgi:hypothetical protein